MHLLQLMLIAAFAVEGMLIVRVFSLRLQYQFRWFLGYLGYCLVMGALATVAGVNSRLYCHAYWLSRPVDMILKFLIVKGLFGDLYSRNRGLRWMARLPVLGAVLAGVAVATAMLYASAQVRAACTDLNCQYARFLEVRSFALAALVVFMLALLVQIRTTVNVGWNTSVHAILLTVLMTSQLLTDSLHLLPVNRSPQTLLVLNMGLTGIHLLCIVMWSVLLRAEPKAEPLRMFRPYPASQDSLLRLTALLDSLGEEASIGIRRRIADFEMPLKGGSQEWPRQ